MDDIVNRIRKYAPSQIDLAAADIERRRSLTDEKITQILRNVFMRIEPNNLEPELFHRYHDIRARLRV